MIMEGDFSRTIIGPGDERALLEAPLPLLPPEPDRGGDRKRDPEPGLEGLVFSLSFLVRYRGPEPELLF
jgi:hypothetical protein